MYDLQGECSYMSAQGREAQRRVEAGGRGMERETRTTKHTVEKKRRGRNFLPFLFSF